MDSILWYAIAQKKYPLATLGLDVPEGPMFSSSVDGNSLLSACDSRIILNVGPRSVLRMGVLGTIRQTLSGYTE
jgi:hypothetical protein